MPSKYTPVIDFGAEVTEDQAAPSTIEDGVGTEGYDEVAWFIEADNAAMTCTVVPWYWSGTAWCAGDSQEITGSRVFITYALDGAVALQLVDVSGTFNVRLKKIRKSA